MASIARLACLAIVVFLGSVTLPGCARDGELRMIEGRYRKVFPDRNGGFYYLDFNGNKKHLAEMPPPTTGLE